MLDKKGFNMWANGYDKSVGLSEEKNTYPFAGYKKVLNFIYKKILSGKKVNPKLLDIGFGTGTLTKKLYDRGCVITGVDFSDEMIKLAKNKMPNAKLFEADFSQGLPKEISGEKFDFIIATYSLHHLADEDKVTFLRTLLNNLTDDGIIFIGDVAFN
ncbi:MAG: class I SAM-dependent methyltransferase, partial [Clostridia bacterium]|nr:class I SAM-dependent methyltransferase [Clostridia bacterium]